MLVVCYVPDPYSTNPIIATALFYALYFGHLLFFLQLTTCIMPYFGISTAIIIDVIAKL